jgi:hypothetical protein
MTSPISTYDAVAEIVTPDTRIPSPDEVRQTRVRGEGSGDPLHWTPVYEQTALCGVVNQRRATLAERSEYMVTVCWDCICEKEERES